MKFLLATNYDLAMDPFVWPEPQNLRDTVPCCCKSSDTVLISGHLRCKKRQLGTGGITPAWVQPAMALLYSDAVSGSGTKYMSFRRTFGRPGPLHFAIAAG